jgi:hypothetical protein
MTGVRVRCARRSSACSWCTQNTCGVDWCTSAEVLDVAATIKSSGLQAIGYDHINLDDWWVAASQPTFPRPPPPSPLCVLDSALFSWGERDNTTGKIIGDPERFPEGMPAFIAKLHAMDFKFGLVSSIRSATALLDLVGLCLPG